MKVCSICGASNVDSLVLCGSCGSPLDGGRRGADMAGTVSGKPEAGNSTRKFLKCAVCGTEGTPGGQFCRKCGAIVAEPIRADDPRLVGAEDDLRNAIESRRHTDRIIEPMLAAVPLVLTLVGAIAGIATMFANIENLASQSNPSTEDVFRSMRGTFLMIAGFSGASVAFLAVITYLLVKRRNDHFSREREVKNALIKLVKSAAWSSERYNYVETDLRAMELYSQHVQRREPLLWSLAIALGGVGTIGLISFTFVTDTPGMIGAMILAIGLSAVSGIASFVLMVYMFYWLGKDIKDHDTSWSYFSSSARGALSKLGFPQGRSLDYGWFEVPERSFILYFVLMIFFSPFVYYWWYTLMKDPNEHFKGQWMTEDALLASIGNPRSRFASPVTHPLP